MALPEMGHDCLTQRLSLACAALATVIGCQQTSPHQTAQGDASSGWTTDAAPPAAGSITYRYEWSVDGLRRDADGMSWSVDTDLGYTVSIHRGTVISSAVQLTQCAEEDGTLGRLWRATFGLGSARAGHSAENNPAALTVGVAEDLLRLTDVEGGTVGSLTERFCGAHYLVSPGERDTRRLPADVQMVDRSLYLEGAWRAPGSSEIVPFTVDTSMSWGMLASLYPPGSFEQRDAQMEVDPALAGVLVVVHRRAGKMFDGVDFQAVGEGELSTRVLSSFFRAAEIGVVSQATASP